MSGRHDELTITPALQTRCLSPSSVDEENDSSSGFSFRGRSAELERPFVTRL